jgi:DNA recombination protein RmuC
MAETFDSFFWGVLLGVSLAWLFVRTRVREARERAYLETETQRAVLLERLATSERLIALNAELTHKLRQQSELRAAAEEKASRAGEIQNLLREREAQIDALRIETSDLKARAAQVEATLASEQRSNAEKISAAHATEQRLTETFKALSIDALQNNSRAFMDLAKASLEKFQESAKTDLDVRQNAISAIVKPVQESLDKVDGKIQEIEKARIGAYESLQQQVRSLFDTQLQLRMETANLVKALRSPVVRGRWGEIQLKRVVEMAGMLDHCDFFEQESVTADGSRLRPDMIVRLPGGKNIVIDAKAPLASYLESLEAGSEETRLLKLQDHARQVRVHLNLLGGKAYWDQFRPSPEFVVLFLPGETFFSAALEQDPALIEAGVDQRVILATPTTLIALLRAVFHGWRQEALERNAQEISQLGAELYKRLSDLTGHWLRLGKSLDNAVDAYNNSVGTLESRVLVTARKFKDLEAAAGNVEIAALAPIEPTARRPQADDLLPSEVRVVKPV